MSGDTDVKGYRPSNCQGKKNQGTQSHFLLVLAFNHFYSDDVEKLEFFLSDQFAQFDVLNQYNLLYTILKAKKKKKHCVAIKN